MSSTYTVAAGDTLATLAQTFYHDAALATLIEVANNLTSQDLTPGQVLVIPGTSLTYTAAQGDTLAAIIPKLYYQGDAVLIPLVAAANKISNPDTPLIAGEVLTIPDAPKAVVQSQITLMADTSSIIQPAKPVTLSATVKPDGINSGSVNFYDHFPDPQVGVGGNINIGAIPNVPVHQSMATTTWTPPATVADGLHTLVAVFGAPQDPVNLASSISNTVTVRVMLPAGTAQQAILMPVAGLGGPAGVAVDRLGNVYVGVAGTTRVLKVTGL